MSEYISKGIKDKDGNIARFEPPVPKETTLGGISLEEKTNYDEAYTHSSTTPHAPSDAEKNIITTIKKNGTALTPDDSRAVDIAVPTSASDVKAVSTDASQGLTTTQKENARANIGAGTSSFSGSYTDLINKPTLADISGDATHRTVTDTQISQIGANADNINTLKGSGEGSIDKMISDKINSWASQLTDDGTVNTYAEAINWIATHASDYTALLGDVENKVDKESGKGLSTNDLTTTLKTNYDKAYTHSKSSHARTDATKTEKSSTNGNIKINGTETTVYTHPSGTNPHGTTKSDVGLGNVPNVATNDQTPSYTEASSLAKLTSGEKLSVAFGKLSKAVTDTISHLSDSVKHITNTERTNWNAAKTHADSAHAPSSAQANVIETVKVNGTALTPSSKAVNITVPVTTDTYSSTGTAPVSGKAVASAIGALDVSAVSVGAAETIKNISETDGKISVTKQSINIKSNQVSGMTSYSKAKSSSAIETSDSLNTAIGKLEYKADTNVANIAKNKTNISTLAKHMTGDLTDSDFQEDSTVAMTKTVPSGMGDYAAIKVIGGKTVKDEENQVLKNAVVESVVSTSADGTNKTTLLIPDSIKSLPDYGVEGNVVDFENGTYTHTNTITNGAVTALSTAETINISDMLMPIRVEAGGTITFQNEHNLDMPNTVVYKKEVSLS